MIIRWLPRRLKWMIHSITRRPFDMGMVANGVSVVIFDRNDEPVEYHIGRYYTFPCMHNNELMRCEKIFFLHDMVHIVFDAFTMIGYQRFMMKTSDTEHLVRIMDKATFLKQPSNVVFDISSDENILMTDPFYIKGDNIGNSGDFYFSKIHTELDTIDFASPGKRERQTPARPLPFEVGFPQKASQAFRIDKGTVFMVFDTGKFTDLILQERAWLASKRRKNGDPAPLSGA